MRKTIIRSTTKLNIILNSLARSFRLAAQGDNATLNLNSPLSAREFIEIPTSDNFFIFFSTYSKISKKYLPAENTDNMVFDLLEGNTKNGFNCQDLAVRSSGCGVHDENVAVYPATNWIISRGLKDTDAIELSHWLKNGTINLFCNSTYVTRNEGMSEVSAMQRASAASEPACSWSVTLTRERAQASEAACSSWSETREKCNSVGH